mmetsp:Transcript_15222/g.23719  ORF Transcript_15222/g.23719 Transcript_15222/m.23719 type:complete len:102 (-) Transcript_15222:20-325(-)
MSLSGLAGSSHGISLIDSPESPKGRPPARRATARFEQVDLLEKMWDVSWFPSDAKAKGFEAFTGAAAALRDAPTSIRIPAARTITTAETIRRRQNRSRLCF